jgi:hypothetical protein
MNQEGVIMSDYLDAMIEARDKELSRWLYKYSANDNKFLVYRDGFVVDAFAEGEIDRGFNLRREKAAMQAAYEAARDALWGTKIDDPFGRMLYRAVHHKDGDLSNNEPANLLVMQDPPGLERLLLDDTLAQVHSEQDEHRENVKKWFSENFSKRLGTGDGDVNAVEPKERRKPDFLAINKLFS